MRRDDFTCVKCGSRELVEADHIVELMENLDLALDPNNGQTLCVGCHGRKSALYRASKWE